METFSTIKGFITDWKKSFIGGLLTIVIGVIGIFTGAIKIWETAEKITHSVATNVQTATVPIHEHVTLEINRLIKRLEQDNIIKATKKASIDSVELEKNRSSLKRLTPSVSPKSKR